MGVRLPSMGDNHVKIAGRYVLLEVLGAGGAGAVWRGRDELLDRAVAVKEVRLAPSDPGRNRDRVMREARAAARLNHPNVTAVYDVVADADTVHIVMELVQGESLSERVGRDGRLAPAEAARLGLGVLGALEAAHRRGIVHRDVKPGNVLLPEGDDEPKLTDFGIASIADDAALTMTGTVLGSPSFIAPEQASGRPVGPAADLWGLGALLYFAVEGVAPFDRGDPLPTLTAVVHEPPRPAEHAGPLGPVIADLLHKDPAQRPAAAAVRHALVAAADGHAPDPPAAETTQVLSPAPPAAPPPPPAAPEPAPAAPVDRGEPGSRAPVVLGAVVALAVLGVLAASWAMGGLGGDPQAGPIELDERGPEATEPAGDADEGDSDPTEEPTPAEPEGTEDAEDDDAQDTEPQPATVQPEGWESFTFGPGEATVAHPADWEEVQVSGTITDLRSPASGAYLRTDWTDTPAGDPVEDWRRQSAAFGERQETYEEVRIEPMTVAGHEGAIWEYIYSSGGPDLRAVNIAIVTGDAAYALNFQTPAEEWEAHQETLDRMLESFDV